MTKYQRFMVAISTLDAACVAVSLSQLPQANAAHAQVSDVVRTRHLEVVDEEGRVRASITVHRPNPNVRLPDGTTEEEGVVLRLVNADGRPGVKLASSQHQAGLA